MQTAPVPAATDAATSGFRKAPTAGPIKMPIENDAMMMPKADALSAPSELRQQCISLRSDAKESAPR